MGFGTKLKRRLRKLGHKIAHGVSIDAKKSGEFMQKAGKFTAKIAPMVALIPDSRAQKFAEGLKTGGEMAQRTGKLTTEAGRSGLQALEDGDGKAFLERSKKQRAEAVKMRGRIQGLKIAKNNIKKNYI